MQKIYKIYNKYLKNSTKNFVFIQKNNIFVSNTNAIMSKLKGRLYSTDAQIDAELIKFLNSHLYGDYIQMVHTTNKVEQVSGIDGYLTIKDLGIFSAPCDEKCSSHYVNNPLPTFLMETGTRDKNGEYRLGWFLQPNIKTEYYILMYPYANVNKNDNGKWKYWEITEENITKIDFWIVKKSNIEKWFMNQGFNYTDFVDKTLELQANYKQNSSCDKPVKIYANYKKGFHMVASPFYVEHPINLCILIEKYVNEMNAIWGTVLKTDNGIKKQDLYKKR